MNLLKKALVDTTHFAVVAELTSGRGYSLTPIENFLTAHKNCDGKSLPEGFTLAGVTLPQNPGGISNLDPSDVLAQLATTDLLNELEFIPHLSCKDHNKAALASILIGYRQRGVQSILALTGDKPISAKGVFELEALGLLQLIGKMNRTEILGMPHDKLDQAKQIFAGAAVSPFKYSEPSQMQQYFKMEKKVSTGARFLITQVGWDWKKSYELKLYMEEINLNIPVLGNVYFLTTTNAAPRLMNTGKLPGCYVSDELLAKLKTESLDEHIERAAQQIAMYKSIGYAGIDLGGVPKYETFCRILKRAAEIGESWSSFKDNLCWTPEKPFYLYDQQNTRQALEPGRKTFHQRWFNVMHRSLLDPEHMGFRGLKTVMELVGAKKNPDGFAARSFFTMERLFKQSAFQCEECGDCYLPENFGYCTIGGCAKGLSNSPCGDAKPDGTCGNAEGVICRGEQIYLAAKAEKGGLARLRKNINRPRIAELEHTSSILNYLFEKDHTMKNAIINIGEDIHASIPKHSPIMRELHDLGEGAYINDSPQLNYVRALIENQVEAGADYIAINVDAFGESDPQVSVDIMVEYVKLIRKWGGSVPVCIDSSNDNVLIAGLKEWYSSNDPVSPPLVNSIKTYTADKMMLLKKEYDFSFIGMLVSEEAPTDPSGAHTIDELVALAKEIFEKAMQHGFKPQEIFFDSTVYPLAIDMPMMPDVAGYTYRAFETMKAIKGDPAMQGVHFSMGVSNCCRDLPGRKIGICRAYVETAMKYGLDAGIVNTAHKFGNKPAAPELVELVEAFAAMDGDSSKTDNAIQMMSDFCSSLRK